MHMLVSQIFFNIDENECCVSYSGILYSFFTHRSDIFHLFVFYIMPVKILFKTNKCTITHVNQPMLKMTYKCSVVKYMIKYV